MIKKVTPHLSQNELLIFERSSPGKKAYQLPALDVPAVDPAEAFRPTHFGACSWPLYGRMSLRLHGRPAVQGPSRYKPERLPQQRCS